MKSLMLLLALGLASTEKLDRSYLPPPGSKFSGGDAGDLQVPLEYPKDAYSTTAPFTPGQNSGISSGDTRLSAGIDRGTGLPRIPGQSKDLLPVTPTNLPFSIFTKVPTTTTSYAFTQTTTFPTTEGFETTISPLGSFPNDGSVISQPGFGNYLPSNQGQNYQQINNQVQPGFNKPENLNLQGTSIQTGGLYQPSSTVIPGVQNIASGVPNSFNIPGSTILPNGQNVFENHPGYTYEPQNQYQQGLPSSTASPLPGSGILSGSPQFSHDDGKYTQHLGVQPPRQFVQGSLPTAVPNYQSGVPSQTTYAPGVTVPGLIPTQQPSQGPISQQYGSQIPTVGPQTQQYIDNYGNVQTVPVESNIQQTDGRGPELNQQGALLQPGYNHGGDLNSIQGVSNPYLPEFGGQRPLFGGQPGPLSPTQGTNLSELGGQRPLFGGQQGPLSSFSPNIVQGSSSGIIPQGSVITGSTVSPTGTQPFQTGQQSLIPSTLSPQQYPNNIPGSIVSQPGTQPGQQSFIPSSLSPQLYPSNYLPGNNQLGGDNSQKNFLPGSTVQPIYPGQQPNLNNAPSSQQNVNEFGQSFINDGRNPSQQFSTDNNGVNVPTKISQDGSGTLLGSYSPITTASSITPGFNLPSSTAAPVSFPSSTQSPVNIQPRPARPQAESDRNAIILNYENVQTPEGFYYSFDTSNGIHADEIGTAIDGVKANGSYSYVGDDGKLYSVHYSADENGFRPHGDHIPTPPPIPEAIQRVIEQAAREKEAGISHDGFYDDAKYGHKKYQHTKHRRPEVQDRIIANGADIPDDTNYYQNENYDKTKPKIQSNRKPIESTDRDIPNEYDDKIDNEDDLSNTNKNKLANKFSRPIKKLPSSQPINNKPDQTYTDEDDQNDYSKGNEEQESTLHGSGRKQFVAVKDEQKPNRKNKPTSSYDRYDDEELITGNESIEDSDDSYDENDSTDSEDKVQDLPQRFDSRDQSVYSKPDRRPNVSKGQRVEQKQKPSKVLTNTFKNKYTDEFNEDNYQESMTPESNIVDKSNRRPQDPRYRPANKQRPSSDHLTGDNEQEVNEKTGYEYTPPQNKFKQEGDRFPSRFSDKVQLPTKKPSTSYETSEAKTTVKPFITPNVYRQGDISYEEQSEENIPSTRPEQTFNKVTSLPSTSSTDYETTDGEYIDETESDQEIGDEVNTSIRTRPAKPVLSSTRRPLYTIQQTTARSQYDDDQYTPNRKTHKGSPRPGQKMDRYPENIYQKSKVRRPSGQRTKSPQGSVSSTTPMPFRSSTRPGSKRPQGYYQQVTGKPEYASTYQPSVTFDSEEDDKSTSPDYSITSKDSRKPSKKPVDSLTVSVSSVKRPSSTKLSSRPTSSPIDYTEPSLPGSSTVRPGTSKPHNRPTGSDVFSTRKPGSVTIQSGDNQFGKPSTPSDRYYSQTQPGSVRITSSTSKPNEYSQNTLPGSSPTRTSTIATLPGQSFTTDVPSTTYRPNYSIINTQPTSVSFDAFGRPIQTSGTTKLPGSAIPTQETGLPSTSIFQDSRNINLGGPDVKPTFKPSEARFGAPEYNEQVIPGQFIPGQVLPGQVLPSQVLPSQVLPGQGPPGQIIPGQKLAEFGPSGLNVPGYLGPYSSSNGKVIGEDFSGPKQPQRYDPETGYHY